MCGAFFVRDARWPSVGAGGACQRIATVGRAGRRRVGAHGEDAVPGGGLPGWLCMLGFLLPAGSGLVLRSWMGLRNGVIF